MNEDIEKLKEKLKKILENYEIDKKIGQLSVDSIYHMFPTESKILLDYIEQLQNNWNELKRHFKKQTIELEKVREDISTDTYIDRKMFLKEVLNKMQELEKENG